MSVDGERTLVNPPRTAGPWRRGSPSWRASSPPRGRRRRPSRVTAMRIAARGWGEGWALRPRRRGGTGWTGAYAYQCLPLVVANQWGWQMLCPTDVRVTWDGSPDPGGLRVEVDPQYTAAIKSQFGSGIVTFSPPWLFRTPPGWDLYVKGPSNRWKPNCVPLEGVIETWWLNYTFTLNWKLVEPGTVEFAEGESLGQLVPVPHATFREATAVEAPIAARARGGRASCCGGRTSAGGSPASRSPPTTSTARPRTSRTTSSRSRSPRSSPREGVGGRPSGGLRASHLSLFRRQGEAGAFGTSPGGHRWVPTQPTGTRPDARVGWVGTQR